MHVHKISDLKSQRSSLVAALPLFLSYEQSLPCTQQHFSLKGESSECRWGGYSLQCSSSILSPQSIVSPAVMRFKGAPRWVRCLQCNNTGTAASEFNCSQHLSIWLDLVHRFIGSLFYFFFCFFFPGCLRLLHHRFGFMNSKQYPLAKPSTLHCLITNKPPDE